jgi:hypothetical protein
MKLATFASLAVIAALTMPDEGGKKSTFSLSSGELVARETLELARDVGCLGAHGGEVVKILLPQVIAAYVAPGEAEMLPPPQALLLSPL